jgi:colicin import membrane protein
MANASNLIQAEIAHLENKLKRKHTIAEEIAELRKQVHDEKALTKKLTEKNRELAKTRKDGASSEEAAPEPKKKKSAEKDAGAKKHKDAAKKQVDGKKQKKKKEDSSDGAAEKPAPKCGVCRKPSKEGDHAPCKAKRAEKKRAKEELKATSERVQELSAIMQARTDA